MAEADSVTVHACASYSAESDPLVNGCNLLGTNK